jgi:1-acyl-sn-glycerol-3-phosphate acyltransferase
MRFLSTTAPAAPPPAPDRLLETERRAHAYAREHGVSRPVYAFVRALASAILRSWFRVRVAGLRHIPEEGPVILAPNHKNFLDPFFIGIVLRRHVRYMAKIELFKGPLAWLFPRLGAFPVRRGASDAQALETARTILNQGGLVVVFPEGTRVADPDALGSPHHGAGVLALDTGAPVVPAAIVGTSHLWCGALPKVKQVRLAFLPPVPPASPSTGDDAVAALIDERVWPAVQEEYGRLASRSGLIALLAAVGVGGGVLARRRRDARRAPRLLGKLEPRRPHRSHRRRPERDRERDRDRDRPQPRPRPRR